MGRYTYLQLGPTEIVAIEEKKDVTTKKQKKETITSRTAHLVSVFEDMMDTMSSKWTAASFSTHPQRVRKAI